MRMMLFPMMFFDVVVFFCYALLSSMLLVMGRTHEMCPQATMPGG